MTLAAIPAQGYVEAPYLACFNSSEGDLLALERSLSPAINTYVQAGTPVTFSGNSGAPVTFAVASSSAALLAGPDIDSGLGALQPGTSTYTFTSTKASATPGVLIFWDASFSNATLAACKGMAPKTYTTTVRTFTVTSPTPTDAERETAAKKKSEEEAAAKKKSEEEAPAGTGGVSKPRVKSLTRTQRLAAALERCHKKGRRQRAVCERQARKRFGQAKKTKNKK